MTWRLDFAPLLDWPFLVALGIAALLLGGLLLITRTRGALIPPHQCRRPSG